MLRTVPFSRSFPVRGVDGHWGTAKGRADLVGDDLPDVHQHRSGDAQRRSQVVEAARSYASRIRLIREVIFPLSLPGLLTGLLFSLSLSVLALVGAETIASNAASAISSTRLAFQQTNIVFCGVIIYAALGLSADLVVR